MARPAVAAPPPAATADPVALHAIRAAADGAGEVPADRRHRAEADRGIFAPSSHAHRPRLPGTRATTNVAHASEAVDGRAARGRPATLPVPGLGDEPPCRCLDRTIAGGQPLWACKKNRET